MTRRRVPTRFRNFVFTLNNPTTEEATFWNNLATRQRFRERAGCIYVVFQTELSASGTTHYQGYVEMSLARRLTAIKTKFGSRIHAEPRMGTQAQAIAYAKKTDTRVEGGAAGEGGEAKKLGKDKLATVAAAIKLGETIATLTDDYPVSFIKYGI